MLNPGLEMLLRGTEVLVVVVVEEVLALLLLLLEKLEKVPKLSKSFALFEEVLLL